MKLFSSSPQKFSTLAHERLTRYDFSRDEIAALADFLDNAQDSELFRINPRRIAARTGLSLHRAAELAAMCVREGIFDLLWMNQCPKCQGMVRTFDSLRYASMQDHCDWDDCDFEVRLDKEMLVEFTLHPNIRTSRVAHADAKKYYSYPLEGIEFEFEKDSPHLTPIQRTHIIDILRVRDEHRPLTGLELMHVPMFRDFFTDQVLPVEISLRVTRVAILFTDLRGSTALYAAKGDPQAYRLVREHFDLLLAETVAHNGIVIKTIGDAVMASFIRTEDAAAAAVAFQQKMAAFNAAHNLIGDDRLILKIGLHAGPCLSVTLNGQADYFGTMVNVAARLGALSRGDDIVVTADVLDDTQAQHILNANGFGASESTAVRLRGLNTETSVVRFVELPVLPPVAV